MPVKIGIQSVRMPYVHKFLDFGRAGSDCDPGCTG